MNDNQREAGPYYFGYFSYNGLIMVKVYGDAHKNSTERPEVAVQEHVITAVEADLPIKELKDAYPYIDKEAEAKPYIAPESDSA